MPRCFIEQSNFEKREGKQTHKATARETPLKMLHIMPVKLVRTHIKPPAYKLSPAKRSRLSMFDCTVFEAASIIGSRAQDFRSAEQIIGFTRISPVDVFTECH
jgi:hypothetical protein